MTVPSAAVARWALLAVLPFWSVYLAHAVLGPHRPTGFLIFDCAYYCANAREIFERGNGLAYCNPFDPDPAATARYDDLYDRFLTLRQSADQFHGTFSAQ